MNDSDAMDYGLPPRPPTASTAVWKHLLRTTTTTEPPKSLNDIPIIAPPMAPLDKNATSMRVLLHDTQVNFERFTTQVGKLFETIQETKDELTTMQSLFQRDRESLTGDIVDLVNRSQREIQKAIGTPTQSEAFENLCKNINNRLDGLDQRLEAMNAFNQTHSQALQTQMHTVQLILDKQGSIFSAVTPLLPFLQGLPPLVEALRTILTEKLQELSASLKNHPRPDTSPITTNKRKRTFVEYDTTLVSPCNNAIESPELSPKRSRQSTSNGMPRVTDSRERTLFFPSSSSPLPPHIASIETSSGTTVNAQPQEKQTSATQNLTTPRRRLNNFVVPPFPPPSSSRRRLGAINLASSSAKQGSRSLTSSAAPPLSVPTGLFGGRSHTNVSSRVATQTPQGKSNTPTFFDLTPTAAKPPHMLRVPTPIVARRSNGVAESHVAPASMGNTPKDFDLIDKQKEGLKPPKHGEQNLLHVAQTGRTKSISSIPTSGIGRLTRSNTRALNALGLTLPPQPSVNEVKESDVRIGVAATLAPPRPLSTKGEKELVVYDAKKRFTATDPTPKGKNIILPSVPGKTKERRSPVVRFYLSLQP